MTASIPLSNYVYNNEHFVLYIEYHWKNNKAIITFGWIYFMGYVEQGVREVVRWKCGMREKTIQLAALVELHPFLPHSRHPSPTGRSKPSAIIQCR